MNFCHIRDHISSTRMQKIYQPVMILALLDAENGWAADADIVSRFAGQPECSNLTGDELLAALNRHDSRRPTGPGAVLVDRNVVARENGGYSLLGFETLTSGQKDELRALCHNRLEQFRHG